MPGGRPKISNPKRETIAVRMEHDTAEAVRAASQRDDTNPSEWIRRLIDAALRDR